MIGYAFIKFVKILATSFDILNILIDTNMDKAVSLFGELAIVRVEEKKFETILARHVIILMLKLW